MKKKLYREVENKLLGGVLAGVAEYFDQDVVLWRLGFIILLILTGLMPGVLIYVAAWVVVPTRPSIEPLDKADYTVV
jgi:phage shock protein PspC (stress-responsive transcriptional regulator)